MAEKYSPIIRLMQSLSVDSDDGIDILNEVRGARRRQETDRINGRWVDFPQNMRTGNLATTSSSDNPQLSQICARIAARRSSDSTQPQIMLDNLPRNIKESELARALFTHPEMGDIHIIKNRSTAMASLTIRDHDEVDRILRNGVRAFF